MSLAISGSPAPVSLNFVSRSGWSPARLLDEIVSNSEISRLCAVAGPAVTPSAISAKRSGTRFRALAMVLLPLLLALLVLRLLDALAVLLDLALGAALLVLIAVAGRARAPYLGRP